MTSSATTILVAVASILLGIVVTTTFAFVRPAAPYQLQPSISSNNPKFLDVHVTHSDPLAADYLDNPEIEMDTNIVPGRKCSVCIGVSQ